MTIKKIFIIISIILLAIYQHSAAQTSVFYKTGDQISSSLINSIYQDKKGYLWIATEYGLNIFDGNQFHTLRHKDKDPNSLCNNHVRTIFEDSQNNIWIGTMTGLMKYHRESNTFTKITLHKKSEIINPHVSQIIERKNGEIWIATSNEGIFQIDPSKNSGQYSAITYQLNLTHISSMLEDNNEQLWLGSESQGIAIFNPEKQNVKFIQVPELSGNNVSTLAKDNQGNIYIGTFTQGLNIYQPTGQKIIQYPHKAEKELQITSLLFTQGKLLIGTDGGGMKVYSPATGKITEWDAPDEIKKELKDAKIHSILQDKDKNLWLGLFQKGIAFIPQQLNIFQYYGSKIADKNPIGAGCVISILETRDQHLFIGIDSKGLYELDAEFNQIKHYQPNKNTANTILSLYEDTDNNLWIGSYTQGISKFNRKNGTWENIPELSNATIYNIKEDNQRNLYISTYGSGMYVYNLDNKKLTNFQNNKQHTAVSLPDNWINTFYLDKNGMIWIGMFTGVSCFNPSTQEFIHSEDNNYLIKSDIVHCILEGDDQLMWIGTADGLYSYNKENGETKRYTQKDGLSNDAIAGLCKDKEGNIWISTFNGISKYNPHSDTFINFYAGDGLQGNEFTRGAFFHTQSGNIIFGGINGITSFVPEQIIDSPIKLDLVITNFLLSGEPINNQTLSGGKPIITDAVDEAKTFRLSHNDNTFRITFSTLRFEDTRQTYYKYRIKELHESWQTTPTGHYDIGYNNLPPGKYTLEVRAINRNNQSDIHTYHIIITPPWYASWWAKLLYTILAGILCWTIINYIRIRFQRKRELIEIQHAQDINEAKLQFFINISHEIRTPMTLIITPLEKLLRNCKEPDLYNTYLMIYRNGQRILQLINQLMDIRKIEKGQMKLHFYHTNLVIFIRDIVSDFQIAAQQKQIKISFVPEESEINAWIDPNNFDKVLNNLLANALKFTPDGGQITISLRKGENDSCTSTLHKYIEIQVKDTGIGLDEKQKERIFDRFYQIDNNTTHNLGGTGVGLHLTHSLILLHHGNITAENNTDCSGSTFTIQIPSGCEHLTPEEMCQPSASPIIVPTTETLDLMGTSCLEAEILQEMKKEAGKKRVKTNLNILIVDDEKEIQQLLQEELSNEYRIATCNNGKEAYEYILSHNVDLIISDVMMDEMDGFTLCKKVKQNTNVNHIPIILVTAKEGIENQVEGLDLGADAYLTKPFHIEVLKSNINNLLKNRRLLKNKFSGSQEQADKIQQISIKSADETLMNKIMEIINKNLSEPNLSVEMLAQEVGLSRVHLHRKLKELTSLSTRDFIRNIRMQQAAQLLKEKKLSISEVAYAVGYNNLSHFSSSFKEMYGISPKDYMQTSLQKNQAEPKNQENRTDQ